MDRQIRKARRDALQKPGLSPAAQLIMLSQQLSTLATQVRETAELLREEEDDERQRDAEAES